MPLDGKRILIVEDEPLLALDLKMTLEDVRAKVVAATSLAQALQLVEAGKLDACVADLELWGADAGPLIDKLKQSGIPFLTYSGRADPPTGRVVAHVQKPKAADAVVAELARLFSTG